MTPREVFEDTFRIAELLIQLYRLLENDHLETEGERVDAIRRLLHCSPDEQVQVLANEVFLGCIRENANIPPGRLRRQSLEHLLRQAVVSACTAYEVFLLCTLRVNLQPLIRLIEEGKLALTGKTADHFNELKVSVQELLNLIHREDRAVVLTIKIANYVKHKNLGAVQALETIGTLLGIEEPWKQLCRHLKRKEEETKELLNKAIKRRNDIVHRADRDFEDDSLARETISFAYAEQVVDSIKHVCRGFDELVNERMRQFLADSVAREETVRHA
jgi:hypothetical protein